MLVFRDLTALQELSLWYGSGVVGEDEVCEAVFTLKMS